MTTSNLTTQLPNLGRVKTLNTYQVAVIGVFALTTLLRIPLSFINRDFNDPHFPVTVLIYENNAPFDLSHFPIEEDCWQCYHPKLFYSLMASLIRLWPEKFVEAHLVVGQLINCGLGLLTVGVIWLFIRSAPFSNRAKFFAFALAALNPGFIAINAQYTNDAPVILCGVVALYSAYLFLASHNPWHFIISAVFTFLGLNFKTTGVVAFAVIAAALAIKTVAARTFSLNPKLSYLPYLLIFVISIPLLGLASPFTQYRTNLQNQGTPFALNIDRPTNAAQLFTQTPLSQPGIRSIAEGFFTFQFIDMLMNPIIMNKSQSDDYPLNRTSFWSLVYGRGHSAHYDAWPSQWEDRRPHIQNLSRAIYSVALVPTAVLLLGFGLQAAAGLSPLFQRQLQYFNRHSDWYWPFTFLAYFAFLICLSLLYRHHFTAKPLYIFPVLIAFPAVYLHGAHYIYTHWPRFAIAFDLIQITLVSLYAFDIISLTQHLVTLL